MKSIAHEKLALPLQAPVMFLPGAVLMPHVLMPLYIFEPRYRAMLVHALENERMFCVALLRPGVDEARGPSDFYPVCGLGLVRACVAHEDGTSHVILQGMSRVQVRGFTQLRPFRVAELQALTSVGRKEPVCQELAADLRQLCAEMPAEGSATREQLDEQIAGISDPGMLADMVAHTFLRGARRQQEVLHALEVKQRLQLVIRHLREERAE